MRRDVRALVLLCVAAGVITQTPPLKQTPNLKKGRADAKMGLRGEEGDGFGEEGKEVAGARWMMRHPLTWMREKNFLPSQDLDGRGHSMLQSLPFWFDPKTMRVVKGQDTIYLGRVPNAFQT